MKILFDANLSPALVTRLSAEYPGSSHVRDLSLRSARIMAADPESQERYTLAKTDLIERVVALAVAGRYPRDWSAQ